MITYSSFFCFFSNFFADFSTGNI